jgi:hypothetical protein
MFKDSEVMGESIPVPSEIVFSVLVGVDLLFEGSIDEFKGALEAMLSFMLRRKELTEIEIARIRKPIIPLLTAQIPGLSSPQAILAIYDLKQKLIKTGFRKNPPEIEKKISQDWFRRLFNGDFGFRCEKTFRVFQLSTAHTDTLFDLLKRRKRNP